MRSLDVLRSRSVRLLGTLALAGAVAGVTSCGNIDAVAPAAPPNTEPTQLYMDLVLNYPAVNLSTAAGYSTVQLTATPRDALGNPMTGLPTPTFTSLDTSNVSVTPDGLVTALGVATSVRVIATLTNGPVTHADTASVTVTSFTTPPTLGNFSIHPVPPDSAVLSAIYDDTYEYNGEYYGAFWYLGTATPFMDGQPDPIMFFTYFLHPTVTDANGDPIPGLEIAYKSLDPDVADIDRISGQVTRLVNQGPVRIVVQSYAYGIAKADTAIYTVTLPVLRAINIHPGPAGTPIFGQDDVVIPRYGIIVWGNRLQDSVDVVFDDPAPPMTFPPPTVCYWLGFYTNAIFSPGSSCGTGNLLMAGISDLTGDGVPDTYAAVAQVRQFTTPGVYTYHSTRIGATGRITVAGDP